jgi:hypothetical protein
VTELDGLVRSALRRHADQAPAAGNLLTAVHARSRRLARRRRIGTAAAMLLAVLAIPALGLAVRPAPAPVRPANPDAVRLVPPSFATPVFPFRPGVTPTGGLAAPVVTLAGGDLVAYYAAKDPVRGADVTIRVSPRPPTFAELADQLGPVHTTAQQVRGHPATLRTVVVAPAHRLSLSWPERPGQWVRVDTDDTLTDAELVGFADALAPAAVPVVTPLRFEVVPAGMHLDTSSRSAMALAPDGASEGVDCVLVAHRPVTGRTLQRTAAGVTVTVALAERGVTLLVQVPARYPISDADLLRFAAGIHLTADADPLG